MYEQGPILDDASVFRIIDTTGKCLWVACVNHFTIGTYKTQVEALRALARHIEGKADSLESTWRDTTSSTS